MSPRRPRAGRAARRAAAVAALLCGGASPGIGHAASSLLDAPPGATSCSGCHAARGGGESAIPRLAGRPADEIAAVLAAFRDGSRPATLMNRIATGFSSDESRAIAIWLAEQTP